MPDRQEYIIGGVQIRRMDDNDYSIMSTGRGNYTSIHLTKQEMVALEILTDHVVRDLEREQMAKLDAKHKEQN